MDCSVYGISDAVSLRYVGVTTRDIDKRLDAHVREAKRSGGTHKRHWLRQALDADVVEVELLDTATTSSDALWLERLWIAVFRACGVRLVNGCDGGRGVLNPTKSTREKLRRKPADIGERFKAGWKSLSEAERTQRLSGFHPMAFAGRKHTAETRSAMVAKQRERWSKVDQQQRKEHGEKVFGVDAATRSERARRAANARWKTEKDRQLCR